MEPFTLAALAALVIKITTVLKALTAGAFREAGTQAIVWVVGFLVLLVAAQADVTQSLAPTGQTLGTLDVWSLLLFGFSLGASGSFAYDVKSALDGTDSAREPHLGGG